MGEGKEKGRRRRREEREEYYFLGGGGNGHYQNRAVLSERYCRFQNILTTTP